MLARSSALAIGVVVLLVTAALALAGTPTTLARPMGAAPTWLVGAGAAKPPAQIPDVASWVDPRNNTAFKVRLRAAPDHPAGEFTFVFSTDNQVTGVAPLVQQADGSYIQRSIPTSPYGDCSVGWKSDAAVSAPAPPAQPTAAFKWSLDPYTPLQVDFDASASAGNQLTYSWDFGDGPALGGAVVQQSTSGATPTHIYANPGTYTVTLLVTDSANQQSTIAEQVNVVPLVTPQASFTWIQDPSNNFQIDFDASASTGTKLSYDWNFGDQTPDGTGQTINHAYPQFVSVNVYTVTLTITDAIGRQSSTSEQVQPGQSLINSTGQQPLRAALARQAEPGAPGATSVSTGTRLIPPPAFIRLGPPPPTASSFAVLYNLSAVIGAGGLVAYARFGVEFGTASPGDIDKICRATNPVAVEMDSGCTATGCSDPLAEVGGSVATFDQALTTGNGKAIYPLTSQLIQGQYTQAQFSTLLRDQIRKVGTITGISPIDPSAVQVKVDIAGQAYFAVTQDVTVTRSGHALPVQHVTSYYLLEGGKWLFWFST